MNKYIAFLVSCTLQVTLYLFSSVAVYGQMTSHNLYVHDLKLINPAFVGNEHFHQLNWMAKMHEPNEVGSFSDIYMSYETSIQKIHSGVGVWFRNKKFVGTSITQLNGLYSYQLSLNGNKKLCFGMNASFNSWNPDIDLYNHSPSGTVDPVIRKGETTYFFNSGLGIVYQGSNLDAGISLLNMFPNNLLNVFFMDMSDRQENIYVRYNYKLSNHLLLQPSVSTWFSDLEVNRLDINTIVQFKKLFWVGGGYQVLFDDFLYGDEGNWNIQAGVNPFKERLSLAAVLYSSEYKRFPFGDGISLEFMIKAKLKKQEN